MAPADSAARRRVLVTGAGGSVGAELVPLLVAAGYRVRATALARTPLDCEGMDHVEVVRADLCNPDVATALVADCQVVVHTAARIDITLDWDTLRPINLDAVERLIEAAAAAGVERFVHFSTASLYAPGEHAHLEDDPLAATSPYEDTKLAAERLLQARPDGPCITIVRPSMIYGPRNKDLAAILPALPPLSRGFLRLMIGLRGGPTTNWVHARDVARATVFMLERDLPHGEVLNVADDTRKDFGAMFDDVIAAYGERATLKIPLYRWMRPLLKWFFTNAVVLAVLNRLIQGGWRRLVARQGLDGSLRPKVFPDIGNYATSNWIFANDKLAALGFELDFPDCREGWADAIAWYRRHGWVPGPAGAHAAPGYGSAVSSRSGGE